VHDLGPGIDRFLFDRPHLDRAGQPGRLDEDLGADRGAGAVRGQAMGSGSKDG